MFRCIRLFCCSGIPKSTSSDYYFDPRVATVGPRKFRPEGTRNIISDDEFDDMREEIIAAGGSSLRAAMNLYFIIIIFAVICFAWWVVRIVLSAGYHHHFSTLAIILSAVLTIVPNIILNRLWLCYMRRAAEDVQVMFDRQNKKYGQRGIYWGTRKTLVYIHIRIISVKSSSKGQGIALTPVKFAPPQDSQC